MEDSQYDSSLGGNQDLPTHINVLKFASFRCKEIATMRKHLSTTSGSKLAFQRLPKHMRRRAMSHNIKRVPRRLRQIHLSQMTKSGLASGLKRPSRKYRRRPKNLLDEYVRRKRRVRWLETHIWHAKRFHMVEKWGCKLGDRPCDKAFRACYRATVKHCLVQDLSYLRCLEVEGPLEVLVKKFKEMGEDSGLSIGAKAYVGGKREGRMVFYKKGETARKAIGPVNFVWRSTEVEDCGRVWFWVHPAFYTDLLETFLSTFEVLKNSMDTEDVCDIKYVNGANKVVITEFSDCFNRFRLTGPLAQSVLVNSLKFPSVKSPSEWFSSYLNDNENRQTFADQIDYWKSIKNISNTSVLPPHIVVSLIVTDPRYNFPKNRTKALPENLTLDNVSCLYEIPTNINASPLWQKEIQNAVQKSKISDTDICEIRQQLLVPGTDLPDSGEPIPIILIQQPGAKNYLGKLQSLYELFHTFQWKTFI